MILSELERRHKKLQIEKLEAELSLDELMRRNQFARMQLQQKTEELFRMAEAVLEEKFEKEKLRREKEKLRREEEEQSQKND